MDPIILAFALATLGSDPAFAPPEKVLAGSLPIDVAGGHATPAFHDWDGDGLKDLLVGQFEGGRLRLYKNQGRKGAPEFGEFEYVGAGGAPAAVPTS